MFSNSHKAIMIIAKLVSSMLNEPGLERLREWTEIGPVQRCAVEQLVQLIITTGLTIEDHAGETK